MRSSSASTRGCARPRSAITSPAPATRSGASCTPLALTTARSRSRRAPAPRLRPRHHQPLRPPVAQRRRADARGARRRRRPLEEGGGRRRPAAVLFVGLTIDQQISGGQATPAPARSPNSSAAPPLLLRRPQAPEGSFPGFQQKLVGFAALEARRREATDTRRAAEGDARPWSLGLGEVMDLTLIECGGQAQPGAERRRQGPVSLAVTKPAALQCSAPWAPRAPPPRPLLGWHQPRDQRPG